MTNKKLFSFNVYGYCELCKKDINAEIIFYENYTEIKSYSCIHNIRLFSNGTYKVF